MTTREIQFLVVGLCLGTGAIMFLADRIMGKTTVFPFITIIVGLALLRGLI